MATRTGMGGFPEGWAPGEHYPEKWARRFAVDFVGGDLKAAAPKGIESGDYAFQWGSEANRNSLY